ncbi:MAG TPA: polysaccharide deacetylase family protein [Kofleriaceae bacterium]
MATVSDDSRVGPASLAHAFWLSIARASASFTAARWRGVRFLAYHSVASEDELPGLSRRTLVLSEDGFRNHLAWIRRHGYVVVSMADARRLLRNGDAARAQFVCLTFDDGRLDNFTVAWPLLQRAGYSAHFFVNSAVVGGSFEHPLEGGGVTRSGTERFMDAEALRAVVREGGSIGSHAHHHTDLTTLGEPEILRELVESRRALEAWTGGPIDTHAYPYAQYDARVLRATEAAGYTLAFNVNTGTVLAIGPHNRFALPRNVIRTGADNPDNYAIIRGGFDFTRFYTAARQRWKSGPAS